MAATTTQTQLVASLGVDRAIDYRKEKWWELESEFEENPFDLVVDLVNGQNWQAGGCSGTKVLKGRNTTYLQLLSGVETEIDSRTITPGCLKRRCEYCERVIVRTTGGVG